MINEVAKDAPPHLTNNLLPTKRGFKMASLNITSLTKHIDELRILLANYPLDVISINETRLDQGILNSEIYIPGYKIVRRDRNRNGGGVCFYIKTAINYFVCTDLNINNLENLCLEIRKPNSKLFVIVVCYRPPNSPNAVFSSLENHIGCLDSENVKSYLMGDMNCNMALMFDTNSHLLSDITDLYGLHQLIDEPTCITDTTSTLIDLIYTNCPDKVVCSGVCHVSISDHSLIFAYRKLLIGVASKRHNTIEYRSFKNFSRDYFRSNIASENWDALDNFQDPNNMWCEWKIKFLNVVDAHAPLRTKRVRSKRSPWITSELKKCMHERDIMKLKAIHSKNLQDWGEFKRLHNKVNSDIRIVKESYNKKSFTENKNDSRRTWQTINELTSRKSNTPSIKELIVNGVSINKFTDLANALIQPHFDYCNVVWGSFGVKLADKLQKLQNCASRALTFSSYDADALHLFQNLNWKNLSAQRDIQKALIMVFKSLNGLAPEYLSSKFIARSHTTSYTFQDSVNKLTIPQPRTNYYLHNSFCYSGAVLWNSFPETLRQAESLRNFKSLLHSYYNSK